MLTPICEPNEIQFYESLGESNDPELRELGKITLARKNISQTIQNEGIKHY